MANSYNLWFREKYRLAPTDPRYLAATLEDIEAEYWAYHYQDKKVTEEFEDDDFDKDKILREIDAEAEAEEQAQRVSNPPGPVVPDEPPIDPAAVNDWEDVPDL